MKLVPKCLQAVLALALSTACSLNPQPEPPGAEISGRSDAGQGGFPPPGSSTAAGAGGGGGGVGTEGGGGALDGVDGGALRPEAGPDAAAALDGALGDADIDVAAPVEESDAAGGE
jgi:hypothetical protein